jgi:tyrosinase
MSRVRRDVATLGSGWNDTLHHYALAMRALDALPISDRNSWKFLGAMHGFDEDLWRGTGVLGPDDEVPDDLVDKTYGNQCQHGSWYFLPWHRAYLAAFEEIVAAKVEELTGEAWSLPYWNYLDTDNPDARKIPEAFLAETLPDGSANPLRTYPRRAGVTELQPAKPAEFTLRAMEEADFLVGNDGTIGFGGGVTGVFAQGARFAGDLELNPHNTVHRLIMGFMGSPYLAGLDPLFWLHHCNIDRLWEAWMSTPGKTMVRDPRWLEGPADRTFLMPALGGADPGIAFTARDTLRNGRFHRKYDNLTAGTGVQPGATGVTRVGMGPPDQQKVAPIGANAAAVTVGSAGTKTSVALDRVAAGTAVTAMGATTPGAQVVRLYLALEGIRGTVPSPLLHVYVNLPAGADADAHPELLAGSLSLFGIEVASATGGDHAGNGLGFTIDITELAGRLEQAGGFDPDHLRVTLVPGEGISDEAPVTVDKISVLKRSGTVG